MTFPEDLPEIIYWRMPTRGVVLTSLPRRPVMLKGSNGESDAAVVRPRIPYGATDWSVGGRAAWEDGWEDASAWRPLAELPAEWMQHLNRRRGTEMDPRAEFYDTRGVQESLYE